MKDLERCFGVSLAWGHMRMTSGDYIIVHTRSHDMSADIYTKGFANNALFQRLRMLINIYTEKELEDNVLNPPALALLPLLLGFLVKICPAVRPSS